MSSTVLRLFIITVILTGCMSYTTIHTEQLDQFKDSIRAKYDVIHDLEIKMVPTQIQFQFTFKSNVDKALTNKIFDETVLVTHQTAFRQEVAQNLYINKYGNGSSEPHVSVSFDINNDGESDFEFVSSLNKGIGEWYFNDYKSDPVKVR